MFRVESFKERFISLLVGCGLTIPLGRGWHDGIPPWEWNGDRLLMVGVLLIIGLANMIDDNY